VDRRLTFRALLPTDDLDAITEMLHEAYAPLAAAGMRYLASHQNVETTRRRLAAGVTFVAVDGEQIVGTVTLKDAEATSGSPFYDRPGVADFGQFAVRPSYQRCGIGSRLLALVEDHARARGAQELALNTSEHAVGLIAMYQRLGFRFIEHVQWSVVNYRSVILSKSLLPPTE